MLGFNWRSLGSKSLVLLAIFLLETHAVYALPMIYQLPIKLAVQAATEAVVVCHSKGYQVTATIVTREGLVQATIRGDGATPHTIENSFNKAYTMITLGPITQAISTTAIVKSIESSSANRVGNQPIPVSLLQGITFSSGGLAVKVGHQIIGGIGVSGAPSGNFDEECAQAGINKIISQLI